MNVDDFVAGDIDHFWGKKRRAIGNYQAQIGVKRFKLIHKFGGKIFGLKQIKVVFLGESSDWVGGDLLVTADRLIRFGNYGGNFEVGKFNRWRMMTE